MFQLPRFLRKLKVKHFIRPSKADKLFVVDSLIKEFENFKVKHLDLYLSCVRVRWTPLFTCNVAYRLFGVAWAKRMDVIWNTCLGENNGRAIWNHEKWERFTGVDTNSIDIRIIALKRVREMIQSGELT